MNYFEYVKKQFSEGDRLVDCTFYSAAADGEEKSDHTFSLKSEDTYMIDDIEIKDVHVKSARKWVYFDVETGKVKFEYGGIHEVMKV